MNRLLEGDVGTGKTIVAIAASLVTHQNNLRTIYMAPTEILARQHFETFNNYLAKERVKVKLLTGNSKPNGQDWDILIGTHALLFSKEKYKDVFYKLEFYIHPVPPPTEPVAVDKARQLLGGLSRSQVREVHAILQSKYPAETSGILVEEVAKGFQFRTNPANQEHVRRLFDVKPPRFSRAADGIRPGIGAHNVRLFWDDQNTLANLVILRHPDDGVLEVTVPLLMRNLGTAVRNRAVKALKDVLNNWTPDDPGWIAGFDA